MSPVPRPTSRVDNPIVFLDVQIGDALAGRLLIELRADVVPKTAENFRRLCTGETTSERTGRRRHYAQCPFHRVVKGKFCQSGDFVNRNGSGGESTFDSKVMETDGEDDGGGWHPTGSQDRLGVSASALAFEDENFILRHSGAGVLSMVNAGPDSNTSQFYLHFAPATKRPECDDKHVVFGCLADPESFAVLDKMEAVATARGDSKLPVRIRRCGQLVTS